MGSQLRALQWAYDEHRTLPQRVAQNAKYPKFEQ